MKTNIILEGDSLAQLKTLPDKSINMCMTSPPYWALRDYGVEGQLGLEPTFDEYITKLCDIFDEVRRVLRDDGTCWVNIGDTYGGTGSKGDAKDPKYKDGRNGQSVALNSKMPSKCLLQIPARFSIEMANRGWILRNTIIWNKPNVMPSPAKDRFTVDFEYVFFFSKQKKYYFETQYEPFTEYNRKRYEHEKSKGMNGVHKDAVEGVYSVGKAKQYGTKTYYETAKGRNKRTTWKIQTKPSKEAHFAVYPEELCETPIKAGCPEGGVVLDPFFGAGTTGLVALKQKKKFIGIELNPEYINLINNRLKPYIEQSTL